jgi:hypothetical protein
MICFLKERQSYYIALTKIALLFLRMKFMGKQVEYGVELGKLRRGERRGTSDDFILG